MSVAAGVAGLAIVGLFSIGSFKGCDKKEEPISQEANKLDKLTFTVGDCMCLTAIMYKSKCNKYINKIIDIDEKEGKLLMVQGDLPYFDHWYGGTVERIKIIQHYYTPVECPKESK